MKSKDFLELSKKIEKSLKDIKSKYVAVGILNNPASKLIYNNGESVVEVGLTHEYGLENLPQRSFLRVPFDLKKEDINNFINNQLQIVFEGKTDIDKSLNLIGIFATNISKKAFITKGYGTWKELSPLTIKLKNSSQILIDTGLLRNSINWEVRNVA